MSPNLHLFNNLHSLKGIKVILQLIIIGYYSAIFQGNKYLLPNEIICLLEGGVKITSSFLRYLKNQIGIVTHLQMWRPKKQHWYIFPLWLKFQPLHGTTRKWDFQGFLFSLLVLVSTLHGFWEAGKVCLSWLALFFFIFFSSPFGKYSSTSNQYLVEEKPTWLFL